MLSGVDITAHNYRYAYYLSVCGSVSSAPAAACLLASPRSSVCQLDMVNGSQPYSIGDWAPNEPAPVGPQWSYIDSGNEDAGVKLTMKGALQCWAEGNEAHYVAVVHFVCAAEQGPLTVASAWGTCTQTWTLPTPLACRGSRIVDCSFDGYDFRCAAEPHSLCRSRLLIAARCSALSRAR